MKWYGIGAAILQIVSSFMVWVVIPGKKIVVTGVESTGTSFGKPAYFHLLFTIAFLILHFIPKVWAKRFNLPVAALNVAWAIRNYFVITACRGGDCPEKQLGVYLMLIASISILVAALFPDIQLKESRK